MTFQDHAVLVTGAAVGIGFGLCQAFAQAGAWVTLNDINGTLAAEAAAKMNQRVGAERVIPYGLDISSVDGVRRMVSDTAARFGRLDVVIANAGITNFG
ncbi:MAG: SDR family NAD(P)-dependent oxidoreductase, partial [Anaerolineae bacterium]|nr:SDR family NAD(P)-dependent oxidoreductase [Anaerolineae bacterium]